MERQRFIQESLLLDMSEIRGVYVPSLFDVSYNSDGTVSGVSGLAGRETVKRVVSSLEDAEFPGEPLVPLIPPVHDRAMVEVFRGCSQGCRLPGRNDIPACQRKESRYC